MLYIHILRKTSPYLFSTNTGNPVMTWKTKIVPVKILKLLYWISGKKKSLVANSKMARQRRALGFIVLLNNDAYSCWRRTKVNTQKR